MGLRRVLQFPLAVALPSSLNGRYYHGYIIFGLDTTGNFYCYANRRYPYESEPMNRHEKPP